MSIAVESDDVLLRCDSPRRSQLEHIPGDYGPPLVGRTLNWLRDMYGLTARYAERYGPVSKCSLMGTDMLFVHGPDNMKTVYLEYGTNISAKLTPVSPLAPYYAGALLFTDADQHRSIRRFMQQAFKSAAMKGYVARIRDIADRHINSLPTDRPKAVFPLIKQYMTSVAANVFFGLDDSDPAVVDLMHDFVIMNQGMMSVIRKDWPIPGLAYPKSLRASERIERFIQAEIPKRRGKEGTDILTHFCNAKDDDGQWMSDEEIIRQAKFLFFAAHDTTSSTITNMLVFTGQEPKWQQTMREEFRSEIQDCDIEYEHLERLQQTQNIMFETMRFYPPVPLSPRVAIKDCELGGMQIPAGSLIAAVSRSTHMMPEYWSEPLRFDPDRYTPEREEHKQHPYLFVPFGGGAHKCIGMHFAAMVTKVFYSRLLPKYRYELPADKPIKMTQMPLPKPANDLPMVFQAI